MSFVLMVGGEEEEKRVREHAAHGGQKILRSDFNLWISVKPTGKSNKKCTKKLSHKRIGVLRLSLKQF